MSEPKTMDHVMRDAKVISQPEHKSSPDDLRAPLPEFVAAALAASYARGWNAAKDELALRKPNAWMTEHNTELLGPVYRLSFCEDTSVPKDKRHPLIRQLRIPKEGMADVVNSEQDKPSGFDQTSEIGRLQALVDQRAAEAQEWAERFRVAALERNELREKFARFTAISYEIKTMFFSSPPEKMSGTEVVRQVLSEQQGRNPPEYCSDYNNCPRCKTHPDDRGEIPHTGTGGLS